MTTARKTKLRYHSVQKVEPLPPKVKTKAELVAEAMESILFQVKSDKRFDQETLDKFSKRFSENALDAFEWSDSAFKAAARIHAAKVIEYVIDAMREKQSKEVYEAPTDEAIIQELLTRFRGEVMRKAKWPQASTSPSSNYASLMQMSAMAEWLERLEVLVNRIAKGV